MRKFKKLLTLFVAAFLCFGLCAFASCDGDNSSPSESSPSSNVETTDAYVFTVLNADNTPATNVYIQLCTPDGTEPYVCYAPVATDANGKATYNAAGFPGEGVWAIHVLGSTYNQLTFTGATQTPASYGAITLTLSAN